jgi:hypothetical protein
MSRSVDHVVGEHGRTAPCGYDRANVPSRSEPRPTALSASVGALPAAACASLADDLGDRARADRGARRARPVGVDAALPAPGPRALAIVGSAAHRAGDGPAGSVPASRRPRRPGTWRWHRRDPARSRRIRPTARRRRRKRPARNPSRRERVAEHALRALLERERAGQDHQVVDQARVRRPCAAARRPAPRGPGHDRKDRLGAA